MNRIQSNDLQRETVQNHKIKTRKGKMLSKRKKSKLEYAPLNQEYNQAESGSKLGAFEQFLYGCFELSGKRGIGESLKAMSGLCWQWKTLF